MVENNPDTNVPQYQIRIRGILDPTWAEWFDPWEITYSNDETILTGPVADQAALYGLLVKIYNLGMTLVSVAEIL
jgi:hypothetical protein